jgi:hypothetical protein
MDSEAEGQAMTEYKTVLCKGSGKPIVWAKDAQANSIPLDPRAPVYGVKQDPQLGNICARTELAMVSHFATCSHANQFGKGKKAAG